MPPPPALCLVIAWARPIINPEWSRPRHAGSTAHGTTLHHSFHSALCTQQAYAHQLTCDSSPMRLDKMQLTCTMAMHGPGHIWAVTSNALAGNKRAHMWNIAIAQVV